MRFMIGSLVGSSLLWSMLMLLTIVLLLLLFLKKKNILRGKYKLHLILYVN